MTLSFDLALDLPQMHLHAAATVPDRGVTALFGASGSGKTTLLRMLAGLEPGGRGQVRLGDTRWQDDTAGLRLPTHARPLAYVFQEASLFAHLSVRDNLAFGLKRARLPARAIAFDDAVAWLGIGHLLDRRPATLSGGERQRVAIARTILKHPPILLFDEATSSLDSKAESIIIDALRDVARGHTSITIAHRLSTIVDADRIVVLDAGRVVEQGRHDELLAADGAYAALWNSQRNAPAPAPAA